MRTGGGAFLLSMACLAPALLASPDLRPDESKAPKAPGEFPALARILPSQTEGAELELQELLDKVQQANLTGDRAGLKSVLKQIEERTAGKADLPSRRLRLRAGLALGSMAVEEGDFRAASEGLQRIGDEWKDGFTGEALPLGMGFHWLRAGIYWQLRQWEPCARSAREMCSLAERSQGPAASQPLSAGLVLELESMEKVESPQKVQQLARQIITAHGQSSDLYLQGAVCFAEFHLGIADVKLNRMREALAAFDEMNARTAGSEDPRLRRLCALAAFSRAGALELLGRAREARGAYSGFVDRYSDLGGDPQIAYYLNEAKRWLKAQAGHRQP